MFGLTEIQLMNDDPKGPRRAVIPERLRIMSKFMTGVAHACGYSPDSYLDTYMNRPFTHGEWEARQKAGG